MFLITAIVSNILRMLQAFNVVDLSWQVVSGDIFSCQLWVFGYFVMCNILNSYKKSVAQKSLIKA